jgi:hypothetical protein
MIEMSIPGFYRWTVGCLAANTAAKKPISNWSEVHSARLLAIKCKRDERACGAACRGHEDMVTCAESRRQCAAAGWGGANNGIAGAPHQGPTQAPLRSLRWSEEAFRSFIWMWIVN